MSCGGLGSTLHRTIRPNGNMTGWLSAALRALPPAGTVTSCQNANLPRRDTYLIVWSHARDNVALGA